MIEKNGYILEYLPTYYPNLILIKKKLFQAKSRSVKYHCDIDTLFKKYIT